MRLTAAAYPLGDVLILAMLAHLWSAGGLRNTAGRLLGIGAVGIPGRLMLLAAASLIAPGILLVESDLNWRVDGGVIAVVAAAVFLLVLMRLAGLVRVNQQAVMRE